MINLSKKATTRTGTVNNKRSSTSVLSGFIMNSLNSENPIPDETPKGDDGRIYPPVIEIWCDGCVWDKDDHMPGAASAVIVEVGRKRLVTAAEFDTTSTEMELKGAIIGLESIYRPAEVVIYSDSTEMCYGMSVDYETLDKKIKSMSANGLRAKTIEYWTKIQEFTKIHDITWIWVKRNSQVLNRVAHRQAGYARKRFTEYQQKLKDDERKRQERNELWGGTPQEERK